MDDLSFRPYDPSDLDACAQMASDAWPFVSSLVGTGDFAKLMRGYIELGCLPSTRLEVACVSDAVIGLLFARIVSEATVAHHVGEILSGAAICTGMMLGRYGRIRSLLALLRDGVATGTRVKNHMPDAGAVVELLVVSTKYQRRGIGRALMDRFVHAARDKGVCRIALHSDEMSSWGFYEAYGFERWATFNEVITSRMMGENKKGFVYVMDIEAHPRGSM